MEPLVKREGSYSGADDPLLPHAASEEELQAVVEEEEEFSVKVELITMWSLVWPLLISFWGRMAMASTDASFVGHIKNSEHSAEDYLAAATLSDMVTGVMVAPPLAFNQVLNALVGQAIGAGKKELAGVWLQQGMFWLGVTMLPLSFLVFCVEDVLSLLGFADNICSLAGHYARFNIFWFVPNGLYQCMRFYFQALGLPRPAMWNSLAFVLVNALLNWLFVFGGPFQYTGYWHGFGFVGAAVSLSFSRCLQPLCYGFYMFHIRKAHVGAWPGLGAHAWALHTKARTCEFLTQALPLVGNILFQCIIGQSTTLLISQLGTDAVAASSAISTVTQIWSGALSAAFSMATAIRVGYHLGRGDGDAARRSAFLVMQVLCAMIVVVAAAFYPLRHLVLAICTNDSHVEDTGATLMAPQLLAILGTTLVGICTIGVFSGQGRTLLNAALSFCFEMPASIGGVALLVLVLKATLVEVYWYTAASAGFELLLCLLIVQRSNWALYAEQAQQRQAQDEQADGDGIGDSSAGPEEECDCDPEQPAQ